jgi:hypothetical protein
MTGERIVQTDTQLNQLEPNIDPLEQVDSGIVNGIDLESVRRKPTAKIIVIPVNKLTSRDEESGEPPEWVKDSVLVFPDDSYDRFLEAGKRNLIAITPEALNEKTEDRVVPIFNTKTGEMTTVYVPPQELPRVKFDTGVIPQDDQQINTIKEVADNWVVAQPGQKIKQAMLKKVYQLHQSGIVPLNGRKLRKLEMEFSKIDAKLAINKGVVGGSLSFMPRPHDFENDFRDEPEEGSNRKPSMYDKFLKRFEGTKSVGEYHVEGMPVVVEPVSQTSDNSGENRSSESPRTNKPKSFSERVVRYGAVAGVLAPVLITVPLIIENADKMVDALTGEVISEEQAEGIRYLLKSLADAAPDCGGSSMKVEAAELPNEPQADLPVIEEAETGSMDQSSSGDTEAVVQETAVVEDNGGGVAPYPTSTEGFALNSGGSQEQLRDEIYELAGEDLVAMENTLVVKLLRQGVLKSSTLDEAFTEFDTRFEYGYNKAGSSWNVNVIDKSSDEKWIAKDLSGLTYSSLMPLGVNIDDFQLEIYRPESDQVEKVMVVPVTSGRSEGHFVVGGFDKDGNLVEWFDAANNRIVQVSEELVESAAVSELQAKLDSYGFHQNGERIEDVDGNRMGEIKDGKITIYSEMEAASKVAMEARFLEVTGMTVEERIVVSGGGWSAAVRDQEGNASKEDMTLYDTITIQSGGVLIGTREKYFKDVDKVQTVAEIINTMVQDNGNRILVRVAEKDKNGNLVPISRVSDQLHSVDDSNYYDGFVDGHASLEQFFDSVINERIIVDIPMANTAGNEFQSCRGIMGIPCSYPEEWGFNIDTLDQIIVNPNGAFRYMSDRETYDRFMQGEKEHDGKTLPRYIAFIQQAKLEGLIEEDALVARFVLFK